MAPVLIYASSPHMPYRRRIGLDAHVFHVINRAARRVCLFEREWDYRVFLRSFGQAQQRTPLKLLSYCIMPNHFHLVVGPVDPRQLSTFMHWLTATHSKRWHARHSTTGTGSVYQGRFKAFPVQTNSYLVNACRYVERNPVRARLVTRAEEWPWSSLAHDLENSNLLELHPWPIPKPADWCSFVNREESASDL